LNFAKESAFVHYDVRKFKNTDTPTGYHWVVIDFSPQFYAFGIMSQYLFVDPEKKIIMVRLGEKWDNNYRAVALTRLVTQRYPILEKKW